MKTLLSVDWDFFVPEKPEFDIGHSESLAFLDMMWQSRYGLVDEIVTSGDENGFWTAIGASTDGPGITFVSDSHLFAYSLLRGIDHVLLVDAHHDCWTGDSLGVDKSVKAIYCHNWLREWLRRGKKRRATWIRPKWSEDLFEVPEDLRDKVDVVDGVENWGVRPIDRVHVCRSGCWTPPWLDRQFIEFVQDRGCPAARLQGGPWDPMTERWSEEVLQGVKARGDTIREALQGIKTGFVSSQNFLGAKVELSAKA